MTAAAGRVRHPGRRFARVALGAGLLGVLAWTGVHVHTLLRSAAGLAARQYCSLHLAAGLAEDLVVEGYIARHVRPVGPLLAFAVSPDRQQVDATVAGVVRARARQRPGFGCTLDHGEPFAPLLPWPPLPQASVPVDAAARAQAFDADRLDRALAAAFAEPAADRPRRTHAVVVLHRGRLVAERYAPGIDQATPLPGFSMAKSMTATLVGLLVRQQGLAVDQVVPDAGALTAAGVTVDQLLRMTSGIAVDEDGSGADRNSIMLTGQHDAAAYAVTQGLAAAPGTHFDYSGGGPVVLARMVGRMAGGDSPDAAYRWVHTSLRAPLGLASVVLEADGAGTFLGSSFMLASALDWARLGQLYLQDGEWDGERLLPQGWLRYVGTPTPESGEREYGAGFWVAARGGGQRRIDGLPALPADAVFMHGMMNQAVYILPSHALVIARLGATRRYAESGEWQLVQDVNGALRADAPPDAAQAAPTGHPPEGQPGDSRRPASDPAGTTPRFAHDPPPRSPP